MHVHVAGKTCAGDLSDVRAYIITVRFHLFVDASLGPVHKLHQVEELGVSQHVEALDVPVRGDHDMAVIVRVEIEHRERVSGALEDVPFSAILFGLRAAKYALSLLAQVYVFAPPGSP